MITRFVERKPLPGYAFFRAQLGLTVATLSSYREYGSDAAHMLALVAGEVLQSRTGTPPGKSYATPPLRHRSPCRSDAHLSSFCTPLVSAWASYLVTFSGACSKRPPPRPRTCGSRCTSE